MAFGEVRDLSSRAFWTDYDDMQEYEEPEINLQWKWVSDDYQNNFKCNLLFIIEGASMKYFVDKSILYDKTYIAEIIPKSSLKQVRLFRVPDTNNVICFSEETDIAKSAKITELLEPWITNAENIVSFTIQSNVFHNAIVTEEESFSKRYFRAINSEINQIKPLESPNFITGLSAGVVSLCNHIGKSAPCYVLFTDDIEGTESKILKLISKIGIPCNNI